MSPTEGTWDRAVRALDQAERIGIVGHVRPDGDALGSAIALALAARGAGKNAVVSFGEPFAIGQEFRFLDQSVLVPPSEFSGDFDLVVVCDTGNLDRVGSVGSVVQAADRVLVIDHHVTEGDLGDVRVVDPKAAATTQLVHELLTRIGWDVTRPIAEALYVGLVTDTGRFQYSSTSTDVHRLAADLLAAGVETAPIGQMLYEETPFGYFAVVARVLGRARLEEDAGLVWSVLRQDDLREAGIPWEAADPLIDLVRLAREAGVACLLKETRPGIIKGSLRSRGTVDVAEIAAAFHGGGHRNAAGFTTELDVEQTIARILELLA
ncbi:MAG: bifunctional oligoribonuclease/PAP phosphatase NrnA [Actinomycetota bacterium]